MVAPVTWIVVTLLDGKCLICAFSGSMDPEKFVGFGDVSTAQVQQLLAMVPCKDNELIRNSTSRKAVSRYLRCCSQVGHCWQSLSCRGGDQACGICSCSSFICHHFVVVRLGARLLCASFCLQMLLS